MKYTVKVPPTAQVGSYQTTVTSGRSETPAQQALWDYNSCRAHDGLPPVSRMPAGTSYIPQVTFDLEGNYGHGWEVVTSEDTFKAAREQLKCYRENEGGTYRIIRRAS
jgi:hypothetical protein